MPSSQEPYFVSELTVQGFRAFLEPKRFSFSQRRCLAVFAPNGSGKSSLVDALEFMFSDNGSLDRIGLRASNNSAGTVALAHNLAASHKISPLVTMAFKQGKDVLEGARSAAGQNRARPLAATTVKASFLTNPIIRGYSLRRFVEDQTAEERYAEVAKWLNLGPLVNVQKNLRAVRQQVKAAADDKTAFNRLDTQIARETSDAVKTWDESAVVRHANTAVLSLLNPPLALAELDVSDPAFSAMKQRVKTEEQRLGIASLRQLKSAASAIYEEMADPLTGERVQSGSLPEFEKAVVEEAAAVRHEDDERSKAANAAFTSLWKAAQPLFAEGAPEIECCPICATPLSESKVGNIAGVRQHVKTHLAELEQYAAARRTLERSTTHRQNAHRDLIARLDALLPLLMGEEADLRAALSVFRDSVADWKVDEALSSADIVRVLLGTTTRLSASIQEIEKAQGEHSYAKALARIERLIDLKAEHSRALRLRAELNGLLSALNSQASFVSSKIREKVQSLLDGLRTPTNEIYRQIQGEGAARVLLELPAEEDRQ